MTKNDLNFVIDTNVIISAVLFRTSVARQCFDKVINRGSLLQSLETIDELDNVLRREKFNKYITESERLRFLGELITQSKLTQIVETVTECRDAKDNKFLELAISGKAVVIVSGDQDLLTMHPFRDIPILNPTDFLTFQFESS